MDKRSRRIALVAGILGVMLMVTVLGVGFYGLVVGWKQETKPGDEGRVVTVEDFATFFELNLKPEGDGLQFYRTGYIDDSYSIDYEYTAPDESFFVSSTLMHEPESGDAKTAYAGATLSMGATLSLFGEDLEIDQDEHLLDAVADDGDVRWVMAEGERIGVAAVARRDSEVLIFVQTGYGFSDDALLELLATSTEMF